jgi:hypothetical protein
MVRCLKRAGSVDKYAPICCSSSAKCFRARAILMRGAENVCFKRVPILLLRQRYYRQLADRVEFLRHLDILVISADTRGLVAGDRIRNPLLYIAVE